SLKKEQGGIPRFQILHHGNVVLQVVVQHGLDIAAAVVVLNELAQIQIASFSGECVGEERKKKQNGQKKAQTFFHGRSFRKTSIVGFFILRPETRPMTSQAVKKPSGLFDKRICHRAHFDSVQVRSEVKVFQVIDVNHLGAHI